MNNLKDLATGNKMDLLQMAIKMPDAISTEREDIDESEWADIQNEILKALENIALTDWKKATY